MNKKRGEYGYIAARKKKTLLGTIIIALIGVAIFFVGLFLNKMSNRNLFTIIAVLAVLPAAKQLVAFIVLFPFKTTQKERYQKAKDMIGEEMKLYSDLVITSPEKIMHLDLAAVGNGQVICLLGQGKQELNYVRKYLTEGVHNWGRNYKVKVVDSEKTFLGELSKVQPVEVDRDEEDKVNSYLLSLIV